MSSRSRGPQQPLAPRSPLACRTLREAARLIGALLLALSLTPLAMIGRPAVAYAAGDLAVKVYNDTGRDGVDSGGAEPGVGGLQVAVYSADDRLVGLNNTSAAGAVSFPNLPDGEYLVQVFPPDGYVVSVPGAANTNPGLVSRVQIAGGAATVRVGLRQLTGVGGTDSAAPVGTRSITARVWDDLDSDGAQDADEPGIAGLTVQLIDSVGDVVRTATAGADGRYRFDDAPTGTGLSVRVQTAPTGYTLTRPGAVVEGRDSDGVLGSSPVVASEPGGARGANSDEIDIGFTRAFAGGFVWRDIDADGSFDIGEPRLDGVALELIDNTTGNAVQSATTRTEVGNGAQSGVFRFLGLPAGTYRVRIPAAEFLAGAVLFGAATPPNVQDRGLINGDIGTPAGVPGPGEFVETAPFSLDFSNVVAGSNRDTGANFGLYKGSVGNFVWFDLNRDGLQAGEAELGQNGVLVFVDDGRGGGTAGDGIRNGGELSTLTGNDPNTDLPGFYRFDDLPLGPSYRVVLDSSNFAPDGPLEGLGSSTGTAGTTAGGAPYFSFDTPALTPGAPTAFDIDFGMTRADVGNLVFEDADGDGVYGPGDSPIQGVTVRLVRVSTGTVVLTRTTDAAGEFTLSNLLATPYYATFDLSTAPGYGAFVASPQPAGVTVDPRETQYTDYSDLIAPAVNATTWRTATFTPTAGLVNNGVDAGFFEPVTLTGRAFFDTNNDDQDNVPAEPGMRGVTVELIRDGVAAPVATTTTAIASTGAYTFTAVAPGAYTVRFSNPEPANFAFVAADQPAQGDALASDVDAAGSTLTFSVTSGTPVAEIDAGLTGRATLLGDVFLDADASNTRNAGDSLLLGASTTLTVTVNLPSRLVTTYNAVASVGNPTGVVAPNYTYPNLPGGAGVTYALAVAPPSPAYVASTADQGGDDDVDSDGPLVTITSPAAGGSFDRDQGFFENVTITARVFEEDAGPVDNQFQAGNSGIDGVTVALETVGGSFVLSDTTDVDGLVSFTARPGSYRLNVDGAAAGLSGLTASPGHSDPVATVGNPLASGDSSLTDTAGSNSFGYYRGATLTGRVFFDRNLDNLAAGEPGVQGVSVSASGPSSPSAVTTDATGTYTLTGLLPGSYTVTVTNPDTGNFAFLAAGDSDVTTAGAAASSSTSSIVVGYNATVSGSSDAGLVGRSTVSGYTFEDGDYNGLSGDAADADLAGATVSLTATVSLPNRLSTTVTRSATTSGAGVYSFGGLPGGAGVSFALSFAPPAATPAYAATLADQGGDDGIDSDGPAQLSGQSLAAGGTQARDRGYYQPVTVTARVFDESSGPVDNQYQAGNPGISGVTVTLEPNGGGAAVATGTTSSTGLVTFTVVPGDYQLNVDQADADLAAFLASPGQTDPVAAFGTPFVSGDSSLTDTAGNNSFGFYRTATLRGMVFFDRNLDSLKAGEPGVQGFTVNLRDSAGTTVLDTTTTSATGVYTFTGLVAADYIVEFADAEVGSNFDFITGGSSDIASAATGRTAAVTVAYGTTVSEVDGGVVGRSTVSGYTFEDGDYNGLSGDAADADLAGATVSLTATVSLPNRLSTTVTRSATTSGAGVYSFGGLPGGAGVSFALSFAPPAATPAYAATLADQGGDDGIDSDGLAQLSGQSLAAGGTQARDRGYYQPVTVTATVFDERDTVDNSLAGGDVALSGVTVTLNPGAVTQTTNASGVATFTLPPTPNVTLSVTRPTGFLPSPGNAESVSLGTLASGATEAEAFGYYKDSTFQGSAWYDGDGDGAQDAGEPGMEGISVTLVGDSSGVIATATTALNGSYAFTAVKPTGGAFADTLYRLCFSPRADFGYTTRGASLTADGNSDVYPTGPNAGCSDSFTVKSNTTAAYIDAGYVGALSIGDRVWSDLDGDGIQDAGEPGLGGVTVTVAITTTGGAINSGNPTITLAATSAANAGATANYLIGRVPPASGWRVVSVTPPFGYAPSPTDQGGDDALDSDPVASFGPAIAPTPADLDFGFYETIALGDRVWLDLDGDGAFGAGEPGLPGVRVELLQGATVVDSTVTSAQAPVGSYQFSDLAPGTYSLRFVAPAGYSFVDDGAGSPDADNDNDARLDGTTAAVTLASGQSRATLDAGLIGTGGLSGIAWVDSDLNNTRDAADAGRLAGVEVTLTLTPTLLGAPVTYGAATAADGSYSLAGLPPGAGVVRFVASGPYRPVTANVGSDAFDSDGPAAPVTVGAGQTLADIDQGYRELGRVVWLPLLTNEPPMPDLSTSFTVSPAVPTAGKATTVEVTVTNTGDGPASGFWVDFYINPSRAPQVNEPWTELCSLDPCFGIAWFYEGTLQPGQSVVLNSRPASAANPNGYKADASSWPGFFANGTRTLYVFVDSWNRDAEGIIRDPNGALREHDETNNRAQQSITVLQGGLPPEYSQIFSSPSDIRIDP